MNGNDYQELQKQIQKSYEEKDYKAVKNGCLKIIKNVSLIRKNMDYFDSLDKPFVDYALIVAACDEFDELEKNILKMLLSEKIITRERMLDSLDTAGLPDSDFAEDVYGFLCKIGVLSEAEAKKYIEGEETETTLRQEKSYIDMQIKTGYFHLQKAQQAEKNSDYLMARMEYLKCVESFKQAGVTSELENASKEYESFVKRDPIFKKLFLALNAGIKENPGILQSEITKKFEAMNWGQLYHYDRPIAKDDVYYALYFADKFGYITRTKKGRSYELFSNGEPTNFEPSIQNVTDNQSIDNSATKEISDNKATSTAEKTLNDLTADDIREIRQVVRETAEKAVADRFQQAKQEKQRMKEAENKRLMYISFVVIGIVLFVCLKVCTL